MNNITFRKATIDDIDCLVRLRQQQLQEEGAIPKKDISSALREYFSENIESGLFISWLALCNETIIATSGIAFYQVPPYYQNINGHIGQIVNMHTLKEFRRKGIGITLLNKVIDEARNVGCTTIRVSASKMGMCLYKSYGFSLKLNMLEYKL